jgi:hypothetical protein
VNLQQFLDPFLYYIPHRPPAHHAETAMVKGFFFGPVYFFQGPAFTSLERNQGLFVAE